MPYSLWSHGRLLGSTRLTLSQPEARTIVLEFQPTDAGLAVLPLFAENMRAGRDIMPLLEQRSFPQGEANVSQLQEYARRFAHGPEGSRLFASIDAIQQLSLELRDGAGDPVATSQVVLQDMLEMMRPHVEQDEALDLEPGFPRYILSAVLP